MIERIGNCHRRAKEGKERVETAGVGQHKQTLLKNNFNEMKKALRESESIGGLEIAQFEKALKVYGTEIQQQKWEENNQEL